MRNRLRRILRLSSDHFPRIAWIDGRVTNEIRGARAKKGCSVTAQYRVIVYRPEDSFC
jgi:hypothetical protein